MHNSARLPCQEYYPSPLRQAKLTDLLLTPADEEKAAYDVLEWLSSDASNASVNDARRQRREPRAA